MTGTVCAVLAVCSLVPSFSGAQQSQYADGMRVYSKCCAPCHDPGITHPGTLALTTKYSDVKSGVLLDWTDLRPEITRAFVRTASR